jgi:glutathione S-transferase
MAEYTFYTNPMSRGQIARWALQEAGADYEQVLVDWAAKPARLTQVNPLGKVPMLVHHHGGHNHVVSETAAICHYLAEMSAPELLPREEEKADYFRYLFFAAGPVEQAVTSRAMGWSADEPQKQGMLGFGSYERAIDAFEAMLQGRDYVCGRRFTMADVYVGAQVGWGLAFGSIPRRRAFVAYSERLDDRPARQAAKAIDDALMAEAPA